MLDRRRFAKLGIVIQREYLQRVRSRGFIVFTLLFPALLAGYITVIMAISHNTGKARYRLAVLDLSGKLYAPLARALARARVQGKPQFQLTPVRADAAYLKEQQQALDSEVLARKYDGYLLIPADVFQSGQASYHARTVTDFFLLQRLQSALRTAASRQRLAAAGISSRVAQLVLRPLKLRQMEITPAGEHADQGQTFALAYVLGILLYMMLVMYGMYMMRGVIAEKTNRTAEVVLSSLDTNTLMLGKLIGLGAAGLTQFTVWLFCLALVTGYGLISAHLAGMPGVFGQIPKLPPLTYLALVIYFVLGFLLYAALYGAIGASVSTTEDAQQMQLPITLLLVAAIFLIPMVLSHPSGMRALLLSEVPFFAPILMTLRLTAAPPPLWQIGLSWALMLAFCWLFIRLAAKIYRTGMLMTGKRPNLAELLRWLRAA